MKTLITEQKLLDIYEYMKGKSVWVDYKRVEWLRYVGVLSYEQEVTPGWLMAKTKRSDEFLIRTNYTERGTTSVPWSEFKQFVQITLLQDTYIRIDGKKEGGLVFELFIQCGLKWLPGVDRLGVWVKGDTVLCHEEGSPDRLEIGFDELKVLFGKAYRKAFKRNNPEVAKLLANKDAKIKEYKTIAKTLMRDLEGCLGKLLKHIGGQ